MIKNFPIGDVKTTREVIVPPPLTPFKAELDPILINEDGILIDGLRRLRWAQSQGHKTIRVEIATDFLGAVKNLEKARRGGRMTMRRVYEVQQALRPLQLAYSRELRSEVNKNRRKPGYVKVQRDLPHKTNPVTGSRALYFRATGESQFQSVTRLYRLAEQDPDSEYAKRVRLFEEGRIGKSRALSAVKKGDPFSLYGPVKRPDEQLRLIKGAASALHSTVLAMNNLGEPVLVNPDDYAEALADLRQSRTRISTVIHILEKKRNSDQ